MSTASQTRLHRCAVARSSEPSTHAGCLVSLSSFDTQSMLDGLRRWVEIESPTDVPEAVNRMMDAAEGAYRQAGARIERVPGRDGRGDHLVARSPWGEGEKGILILSHLDTVHPIGFIKRLPFRVEGDAAFGPGICDMKGGVYIACEAFRRFLAEGRSPLPVTHLIVSDEETGSQTSRELIEREGKNSRFVLVTEACREGGKVVTARKGVGQFEMLIRGIASHAGSRPQDGRSAVRELAHQILELEALNDAETGVSVTVGVVQGGTRPNVIPEEARAEIDMRLPTMALADALIPKVLGRKAHRDGVTVTVTGELNRPPYEKTPAIAALFQQARALAAEIGIDLQDLSTGGGSDGNFTAPFVPTLDGLGVEGKGAHTDQEQILISSLAPRAMLLYRLLQTLGA
ncbi:glutamate carboxypeptidase [Rhizobiales bacterium GAS188]|nr:glutamate carboxypeptidase [Rhizobiales bacterium GAS188]